MARGAQAGFLSARGSDRRERSRSCSRSRRRGRTSSKRSAAARSSSATASRSIRSLEAFTTDQLAHAPSAHGGRSARGRADPARRGRRTAARLQHRLTNFELALTMMRLGCVTASALDAGGSTTMAFDGKLLNRPSDPGGERAVADALALLLRRLRAGPTCPRPVAERRRCRRRADLRLQARAPRDRDGDA